MKNTFIFNFKRDLAFSFVEKRSGTFLNQILACTECKFLGVNRPSKFHVKIGHINVGILKLGQKMERETKIIL